LQSWPNLGQLTEEEEAVLANMQLARKGVELALSARDAAGIKIRQMLNSAEFTGGGKLAEQYFVLLSEELNVRSVSWQGGGGSLEVKLDTVITLELQREGNKREIIRTINSLRKEAGLTVADRI